MTSWYHFEHKKFSFYRITLKAKKKNHKKTFKVGDSEAQAFQPGVEALLSLQLSRFRTYSEKQMYVHIHIHIPISVCVCVYVHVYIHTYIHTNIHKYVHTYIHTYIDRQTDKQQARQGDRHACTHTSVCTYIPYIPAYLRT